MSPCQDLTTEASDAVLLGFAPPEEAAMAFQAARPPDASAEAQRAEQALRPGASRDVARKGMRRVAVCTCSYAADAGSGRSLQPATWMQFFW